ncbi:MAG: MFS transporter [Candidatus Manganitrophus sp.]|nr:MAG: MFS transporter [Candidatus Manganitrophus sp.]
MNLYLQVFSNRRVAVLLLLGFSSGLPLALTFGTLQAWMKDAGVDLATIGAITLVGLPYTVKYLWAPLMDRYTLPFLGRRRGWLVVTQLSLMAAIAFMGSLNPVVQPWLLAVTAVLVSFLSASQDIVVDAYRADVLREEELGAGAAVSVLGYRLGMLSSGAMALILADHLPWVAVYRIMAGLMLVGVAAALWGTEPKSGGSPRSLAEAVALPFKAFFSRDAALVLLLFIILYKLPDAVAGAMTTPFLLDVGFSKTEIGAVNKGFGLVATIFGAVAGGGPHRAPRHLPFALGLRHPPGGYQFDLHGGRPGGAEQGRADSGGRRRQPLRRHGNGGVRRLLDEPHRKALQRHPVCSPLQPDGDHPENRRRADRPPGGRLGVADVFRRQRIGGDSGTGGVVVADAARGDRGESGVGAGGGGLKVLIFIPNSTFLNS